MGQIGLASSSVSLICHGWRAFMLKKGLVFSGRDGALLGVRAGHGVDDADEMRARRQMRAEFERHRLVLRRLHVLLEQRAVDVGGVDAQARGAPALGAQAAQLHAHAIFAGRRRS